MKRKFILLTLVIATLIVPANLQAFESTVEEELQTPWEGFGYNQWGFARESDGNTFKPWSDDLWKTTTERILAIKPSLVRLPVIRDWFNKDDDGNNLPIGTYNWDSKYMQAYFKIMDLYKEHDIKVMSGFWGVGYNGEDYKQFYTTDECAQLQADLIEYLFKTKGYDKIITALERAFGSRYLLRRLEYHDKKTLRRIGETWLTHKFSVGSRFMERLDMETCTIQRRSTVSL